MAVWHCLAALAAGTVLARNAGVEQIPLEGQELSHPAERKDNRPNIIFILTDDQDLLLDSMEYMPKTNALIRDQGAVFSNHFVTTAVCCPSRVALWTGRQPHNTNVTDVNPPYGETSVEIWIAAH